MTAVICKGIALDEMPIHAVRDSDNKYSTNTPSIYAQSIMSVLAEV